MPKQKIPAMLPPQEGLSTQTIFWMMILVSLLLGFNVVSHLSGGIGDEDVHRFQINWFIQGRFEIFKHVTMLPLYHGLVALLAKLTGLTSLNGLRFVHMVLAAGVIPAMYCLVRCFYPNEKMSRTLLLVFVPFMFPLFFLTYTDLPSLMLVLFMVERAWKRAYCWAAVLAFFAVLMRQPNIIWVAFVSCLVALNTAQDMRIGWRFRGKGKDLGLLDRAYLLQVLDRTKYFLLVFFLFAVFVFVNGGVAVGDAEQHPISFNLSNLYFFLLVAFVLFLPFNIEQVGNIKKLLIQHWWIWLVLIVAFFIYFNTYEHPHKYNRTALKFYRHNWFLHYTGDYFLARILSFVPMAWMSLSFACAVRSSEYGRVILLMLPFALLSFVPLPLIEQRYYIVALTLFLAMRPKMSPLSTGITLFSFITLCAYILFNVTRKTFFL